jgi:hypothetical protein
MCRRRPVWFEASTSSAVRRVRWSSARSVERPGLSSGQVRRAPGPQSARSDGRQDRGRRARRGQASPPTALGVRIEPTCRNSPTRPWASPPVAMERGERGRDGSETASQRPRVKISDTLRGVVIARRQRSRCIRKALRSLLKVQPGQRNLPALGACRRSFDRKTILRCVLLHLDASKQIIRSAALASLYRLLFGRRSGLRAAWSFP